MLVVTSEMTIAAVTLPWLGTDLGANPSATAWVLLAYALPMAALGVPAGRRGDGPISVIIMIMTLAAWPAHRSAAWSPTSPGAGRCSWSSCRRSPWPR